MFSEKERRRRAIGIAMKKKKKCSVVGEDENAFSAALHTPGKALSSSSDPTKQCMIQKSEKGIAPLPLLLSRKGKENRTLQPTPHRNSSALAAERHGTPNSEKKKKKKKGAWSWGSIQITNRLSCDRLACLISAYIDAINGLPCSVNGRRLMVKLQQPNKGRAVQTKPCSVINGTADIDQTLQMRTAICFRKAAHGCHYSPMGFGICVCAIEPAAVPLSRHSIDLTGVLPSKLGDFSSPQRVGTWATAIKLTGKAKGGVLAVTFACRILEETGAILCSSNQSTPRIVSPCMSDLDLNDEAPFLESSTSDEPYCEISRGFDHSPSECASSNAGNNWAPGLGAKFENARADQLDSGASYALAPDTPTQFPQNLEPVNGANATAFYSSSDEEMEFSIVERGVEMGTLMLAEIKPLEGEGGFSEIRQKGPNCKGWDGEQANRGYCEQVRLIEEELARLETRLDAEDRLQENPAAMYGGLKGLVEDSDRKQEAFQDGIEGSGQKQVPIGSSDDDIDSVTGDFLDLLEGRQSVKGINWGSGSNSTPRWPLSENHCPSLEQEMESSFMDAVELEIQKAEQALRSKARAKILEDAEAEALMRQWGLDEKAFEVSPSKSARLSAYGNSARDVISSPPIADGIGLMVQTRDGGYIRSMNPMRSAGGMIGGQLVMQVSKPAVVPAEMGSNAMDILRTMAALGLENLVSQAMLSMPMEDITGKTIQQIALGGSGTLEAPHHGATGFLSSGKRCTAGGAGNHSGPFNCDGALVANGANLGPAKGGLKTGGRTVGLESVGDSLNDYVALEDLAPVALQKIEALALEGLKIQANMTDQDAPASVDPKPLLSFENRHAKKVGAGPVMVDGVNGMHLLASKHSDDSAIQGDGAIATAISLEKWMKLDVGISREAENKDQTYAAKDAPQILSNANSENDYDRRKSNNSRLGCLNDTLTIAMLVQLRDPLRDYEPVGAPMIALIQAERVIKPPRPKLSKQVSTRGNTEPEEDAEEQKPIHQQPQFKITEVHMSGFKSPEPDKKKGWFFQRWGGKKQEQSASRWLVANGMGKKTKPALPKPKPSLTQSVTTVKPGETLWSISSRVHGTGSKWQEIASLNPHIRNPDIIFANQTIRTK